MLFKVLQKCTFPNILASTDHKIKVGTKCMILLCIIHDTLMRQWDLVGTQWELVGTRWELSGNSMGMWWEYIRNVYGACTELIGSKYGVCREEIGSLSRPKIATQVN